MSPVRVDFYLLTNPAESYYWTLACRLINKAYQQNSQIIVYCDDLAACHHLDTTLWAYQDEAFIPHALLNDPLATQVPVCITTPDSALPDNSSLLINLSTTLITDTKQLQRIIEIIPPHEPKKTAARERFRAYRQQGFTLHTHSIT